jgi:hypothetical protein
VGVEGVGHGGAHSPSPHKTVSTALIDKAVQGGWGATADCHTHNTSRTRCRTYKSPACVLPPTNPTWVAAAQQAHTDTHSPISPHRSAVWLHRFHRIKACLIPPQILPAQCWANPIHTPTDHACPGQHCCPNIETIRSAKAPSHVLSKFPFHPTCSSYQVTQVCQPTYKLDVQRHAQHTKPNLPCNASSRKYDHSRAALAMPVEERSTAASTCQLLGVAARVFLHCGWLQ